MAGQTAAPTFSARFGQKGAQASAKAAKAPVRYGPEGLPPGIKAGIGRITQVRLIEVAQGSPMKQANGAPAAGQLQLAFDAAAVEPKTFPVGGANVKVEGRRFRTVFVPLFEHGFKGYRGPFQFAQAQDLSWDGCVNEACNMMRMLMGPQFDTSNFDAAVAKINQVKPHFGFSTTESPAGGTNPATGQPYPARTWENWGAGVAYKGTPAAEQVKDNTGADAAARNGQPPAQAEEPTAEFNEFQNDGAGEQTLAELAALADGDEEAAGKDGTPENDAAAKLTEAAESVGIPPDDLGKWPNWTEIAAEIERRRTGGGEAGDEDKVEEDDAVEEEEEAKEWAKGDECKYVPPVKGPGGKETPGKKTVKCKITGLNKSKTKANVVALDDPKKKWENVPVDALTRP